MMVIHPQNHSESPSACPHEGRFGSVPHAGFGVGFERLVMLATGVGTPGPRRSEELKSR
jgi:aspartyl-tRNA synthetase